MSERASEKCVQTDEYGWWVRECLKLAKAEVKRVRKWAQGKGVSSDELESLCNEEVAGTYERIHDVALMTFHLRTRIYNYVEGIQTEREYAGRSVREAERGVTLRARKSRVRQPGRIDISDVNVLEAVFKAAATLPSTQRAIVGLILTEGYNVSEVAEELGITQPVVSESLAAAREALRRFFIAHPIF